MRLKPGVTPDALRSAIARDRVNDVLHRQPVLPGDTIDVPAGTVHALLAGAVVAEIQQTSDVTYRLYDWGRVGLDGKPRPLHIDRAMDVIAFDRPPAGPVPPQSIVETESLRRQLLVRRPQFTAERILLGPGATYDDVCDGSTFEIWGCMEGSSTVTWAGAPVDLPPCAGGSSCGLALFRHHAHRRHPPAHLYLISPPAAHTHRRARSRLHRRIICASGIGMRGHIARSILQLSLRRTAQCTPCNALHRTHREACIALQPSPCPPRDAIVAIPRS